MKKKFLSIAALSMALALTFGMTVSASGSASAVISGLDSDKVEAVANATSAAVVSGAPASAVKVDVATTSVANVDKAVETTSTDSEDLAFVGAFELKLVDAVGNQVPCSTSVTVTLSVPGVKAGAAYEVWHQYDMVNGKWEKCNISNVANGSITATFTGLSPVVVLEVLDKDGDDDDDDAPAATTTTATGAPAAPKTAETLPVAGVMAIVCLAGAAVCAKKVRYND